MSVRYGSLFSAALFLGLLSAGGVSADGRRIVSLDGVWQIADSREADAIPLTYDRSAPVPGLANLASPAFKDVDQFISRENLSRRISAKRAPEGWLEKYWVGKVDQDRNYFWYRTTFRAPEKRAVARLTINKAQFGMAVWVNGQKIGDYAGCFTAGIFQIDKALSWNAENTLVVRIGAHPAVLPDTYPTGSDFEKNVWTPGIYDSVSVSFCDNPAIESVQVAPRIATGEAVVQTRVRNRSDAPVSVALSQAVRAWRGGQVFQHPVNQVGALLKGTPNRRVVD